MSRLPITAKQGHTDANSDQIMETPNQHEGDTGDVGITKGFQQE